MQPWMEIGFQGLALVGAGAFVLWLVSLAMRDASIADRFWGLGFVLLAAWYASRGVGWPIRSWLLLGLTAVWGIRLSVHIHLRNRGKPEDPRYARWRENGGASYWWTSLFRVFLLQAVILWIVAAPLLVAQSSATPAQLTAADVAGSGMWLVGLRLRGRGRRPARGLQCGVRTTPERSFQQGCGATRATPTISVIR